jgi:hypothetical protein
VLALPGRMGGISQLQIIVSRLFRGMYTPIERLIAVSRHAFVSTLYFIDFDFERFHLLTLSKKVAAAHPLKCHRLTGTLQTGEPRHFLFSCYYFFPVSHHLRFPINFYILYYSMHRQKINKKIRKITGNSQIFISIYGIKAYGRFIFQGTQLLVVFTAQGQFKRYYGSI